jgi:hypothetical protein
MIAIRRRVRGTTVRWFFTAVLFVVVALSAGFNFGFGPSDTVEWSLESFPEPSGITYHVGRGTLFAVGDQGDVCEISLEGKILQQVHVGGDLEGITSDPSTGFVYIVREGHEIIFELGPDKLDLRRRFTIDRSFKGDPNFLRRGGDGIEGLAFVPDSDHPEGGRLFAVNQYDPPLLIELGVPLRSSKEKFEKAVILSAVEIDISPLSGLVWHKKTSTFLVVSALSRKARLVRADGSIAGAVKVPGFLTEGLAPLPDGRFVIAQDVGGFLLWSPKEDPFRQVLQTGGAHGTPSVDSLVPRPLDSVESSEETVPDDH